MTLNFRRFVFAGDSHFSGADDPAHSPPTLLHNFANLQPCTFNNFALNGQIAEDTLRTYPLLVRPVSPRVTSIPSNYLLHVGSNNIARGDDGATLYSAIVAPLLALAKDDGFYVWVSQPWSDPAWAADGRQAQLLIYNGLLATDPSVTPGLIWNGVAAFPNPNTGPYFDPNDNHLSPAGQQVYANQIHGILQSTGNFL